MACPEKKRTEAPIIALASGSTVAQASSAAGCSERTASRRLADPRFCGAVKDAQRAMVAEATAKLAGTSTQAAEVLKKLLEADDKRIRLSAAKAVLKSTIEMQIHVDHEQRISAIEAQLGGSES